MDRHQKGSPATIFYVYAREDELLRDELSKHMSNLVRQGLIKEWHDQHILAGTDKTSTIDKHFQDASVILVLVSPDFLASDYCYCVGMQHALERHRAGEACVIPILLRPVDWQGTPFADLQWLPREAKPVTSWGNRDDAFFDVARGIRTVIENLKVPTTLRRSSFLPSIWNIPYPRNPFFTGRDDLLTHLAASLRAGQIAALMQPHAISGLGGIGKTQTAVEYAYRHRSTYQAILWIQSDTRDNLISSFIKASELLALPNKAEKDQNIIIQSVIQWLRTHEDWLLILDNADDLEMVREFIPTTFSGHLILTTRAQAMGRLAQKIQVEIMSPEEGMLLLLRRAGSIGYGTQLDGAPMEEQRAAAELVQELGGLPLALDQAGAYIEEVECGVSGYLQEYRKGRAVLLDRRGGLVKDHPASVAATWSLSFEKIERANPTAADLLRLCAFLNPDGIPEEIVIQGAKHLGPRLQAAADQKVLDEAIMALRTYSLIHRNTGNKQLSIHRLVQAVVKDKMDKPVQQIWAEQAVLAVNETFPRVKFATWSQCERYLTNAQVCVALIQHHEITFPEAAHLLYKLGRYLKERARYAEAEPLLLLALDMRKKALGLEHPDTATSLDGLGSLYFAQGKHTESEQFHQRALEVREHCLGAEHPATAFSVNNLAWLYYLRGDLIKAEAFWMRALTISEQQPGPEHSDTMTVMLNLAWLYFKSFRDIEAEQLYVRVRTILEGQSEAVPPLLGRTLGMLAILYTRQAKYTEAQPLHIQALAIREQYLGPEHPETSMSLTSLAWCYYRQDNFAEAEPLFTRALAIAERQLGSEHPETAGSLYDLAVLYQAQGKYSEAELLHVRALAIREQLLGLEHHDTAESLNGLALLYQAQGKYGEAELLYVRALAIREQLLGLEHLDTGKTLYNMAQLYHHIEGKPTEVEFLYKRALAIYERCLGCKHPTTISLLKSFASFLRKVHKESEAEEIETRILPDSQLS